MKRGLGGIALGALAAVGILALTGPSAADDKYELVLKHPEGRALQYKNNYRTEYVSDHGREILKESSPPEWVELVTDGEWRSREVVEAVVESTGTATLSATVSSAFSAVNKGATRLTYTAYPSRLDEFDGRAFTWQYSPTGSVFGFRPSFELYSIVRPDLVTDLAQAWMANYCPTMPGQPVGKDDTWEGEQEFRMSFYGTEGEAVVTSKSVYTVKQVKKQKDQITLEIEEQRRIEYTGWFDVTSASVMVSGNGSGPGKWVIDATNGFVMKQESRVVLENPEVRMVGNDKAFSTVQAEVKIQFKRQLKKIEKP
jgi:hypothetical protein